MNSLNIFSLIFCLAYLILCYQTSSIQELLLANLSFLLISGFFNNFFDYNKDQKL